MNKNTIILIVATLIVAAGAYWYFFTGTGNEPPLTTTVTENEAQMQFQMLVSKLQPITFNTAIFTNPRFLALVDLTTPITPETLGRLDPFAPVPGVSGK
jgi:flagellar basal body-associated protein FliL